MVFSEINSKKKLYLIHVRTYMFNYPSANTLLLLSLYLCKYRLLPIMKDLCILHIAGFVNKANQVWQHILTFSQERLLIMTHCKCIAACWKELTITNMCTADYPFVLVWKNKDCLLLLHTSKKNLSLSEYICKATSVTGILHGYSLHPTVFESARQFELSIRRIWAWL